MRGPYPTWVAALLLVACGPLAAQQAEPSASPHGSLPAGMDCSACHTPEAWVPVKDSLAFDHAIVDAFPLTGAHREASCQGCHLDLRFDAPRVAPSECGACHVDVHEGSLVSDCSTCHVTTSFLAVDGLRLHARTALPLTGAHQQLPCRGCHTTDVGGAFSPLATDCVSCHRSDYEATSTVDHLAVGYPTDCTECHAVTAWQDAPLFDHATASGGFDLMGAHRSLTCASCHALPGMTPLFAASSQEDCVACHLDDYEREHGGSNFSTECTSCHTVNTWDDATFDHALTGFELIGLHGRLGCASCHVDGSRELRYAEPASTEDCVACHRRDYEEEHRDSGFPTTCLSCHQPESWDGARFDHAATGFPLLGAHVQASCTTCHGGQGTVLAALPASPEDCVACHRTDYEGAHPGATFPTACSDCHTTTAWGGATFDHGAVSGFELIGPHAPLGCASCHQVPGYAMLFPEPSSQSDCVACHRGDYDREHAGSGFPTTCLSCHAPSSWSGAQIDHVQVSGGFRLLGAHASASCTSCHAVPGYDLLFPHPASDRDCVACHLSEYQQEHAGSGFPQTCATCHTVQSWASTFDHDAQFFRIYSGPHAGKWSSCATCHTASSNFSNFTCLSCHDHEKTQTDQDHSAVNGYAYESSQCYACHSRE